MADTYVYMNGRKIRVIDRGDGSYSLTQDASFTRAAAVTPHDSTNLTTAARSLFVGGAGNVVAIVNGQAITFTGVPAGSILPIVATRVNATNTTATAIVALW